MEGVNPIFDARQLFNPAGTFEELENDIPADAPKSLSFLEKTWANELLQNKRNTERKKSKCFFIIDDVFG